MSDTNRSITIPENYLSIVGSGRTLRTNAKIIGPADPDEELIITILVRPRLDAPALPDMEYLIKMPPGRRRFISKEKFAVKYGADEADLDKVIEFTHSHGLTLIEKSIAKRTIQVSGTVAQISKAFAITLTIYKTAKKIYRSREGHIYLPPDIITIVEGVFGLDNRNIDKPNKNSNAPQLDNVILINP